MKGVSNPELGQSMQGVDVPDEALRVEHPALMSPELGAGAKVAMVGWQVEHVGNEPREGASEGGAGEASGGATGGAAALLTPAEVKPAEMRLAASAFNANRIDAMTAKSKEAMEQMKVVSFKTSAAAFCKVANDWHFEVDEHPESQGASAEPELYRTGFQDRYKALNTGNGMIRRMATSLSGIAKGTQGALVPDKYTDLVAQCAKSASSLMNKDMGGFNVDKLGTTGTLEYNRVMEMTPDQIKVFVEKLNGLKADFAGICEPLTANMEELVTPKKSTTWKKFMGALSRSASKSPAQSSAAEGAAIGSKDSPSTRVRRSSSLNAGVQRRVDLSSFAGKDGKSKGKDTERSQRSATLGRTSSLKLAPSSVVRPQRVEPSSLGASGSSATLGADVKLEPRRAEGSDDGTKNLLDFLQQLDKVPESGDLSAALAQVEASGDTVDGASAPADGEPKEPETSGGIISRIRKSMYRRPK